MLKPPMHPAHSLHTPQTPSTSVTQLHTATASHAHSDTARHAYTHATHTPRPHATYCSSSDSSGAPACPADPPMLLPPLHPGHCLVPTYPPQPLHVSHTASHHNRPRTLGRAYTHATHTHPHTSTIIATSATTLQHGKPESVCVACVRTYACHQAWLPPVITKARTKNAWRQALSRGMGSARGYLAMGGACEPTVHHRGEMNDSYQHTHAPSRPSLLRRTTWLQYSGSTHCVLWKVGADRARFYSTG